jgi:hypothetical protein
MSVSNNFLQNIDEDLAAAWIVMQRFCSLVNLAAETQRVFPLEIVRNTMASVMYRLLHMSFETGTLEETVRLGLLALSYHLFLKWQDMNLPSAHFLSAYKNNLLHLKLIEVFPVQIMLWLLMIEGISIVDPPNDSWLKDSLQDHVGKCHITSWDSLRTILRSFMWISQLHDTPGKQIFDAIIS